MNEELIINAKNDNRVKWNKIMKNNIKTFCALPSKNIEKIIIYCHGLGSNKSYASRFYEELLKNNIGIIAFDFPGHGEDRTDFSQFSLALCIQYLEQIIQYSKETYNVPIYLFGSSFGGFVILNKLIQNSMNIEKVILMCPAINFFDILNRKTNIKEDYYNSHEYLPLYNGIKIYPKTYFELKKANNEVKNYNFNDIAIIQGTDDKTVLCNEIQAFCLKNNLKLKIIEEGKHELYKFDNEIIKFILNNI